MSMLTPEMQETLAAMKAKLTAQQIIELAAKDIKQFGQVSKTTIDQIIKYTQ